MKYGIAALSLFSVFANAAELESDKIKNMTVNLMSQFYDVPKEKRNLITVEFLDSNDRFAEVVSAAPGGYACNFQLEKAPSDVEAPNGWLFKSTRCKS
mgnify:CR=1 FL=1